MPFIEWIDDDDARGELAELYRQYRAANPQRDRVPGILKCFSHRPDFLRRVMQFSNELHFSDGHLNRRTKELIASLVSALNQCPY
jgi:alkylhydroperoxidase family enzyme